MSMTDEEFKAQLDLADARLAIANGRQVSVEDYQRVIQSLIAGRESRARAIVEAGKVRRRAARESKPRPVALDPALFFGLKADAGEEAVPSSS